MGDSSATNGKRVQEPFLNELRKSRRNVQVYLRSGRRLEGILASFDPHMIQLVGIEQHTVFKHEIMSIARAPQRKSKPHGRHILQGAPRAARDVSTGPPARPVLRLRRERVSGEGK